MVSVRLVTRSDDGDLKNGRDRHVVGLVVERVAGPFAAATSSSGEWGVAEASGGCRQATFAKVRL